jgi:uncharacterized protein YndB with AHSA1/START domain
MTAPKTAAQKRDLVVTRVFNAPVEMVWKAWTDPALVMRWWGPAYFTSPSAQIDFREGATSLVCMRAPKEFGGGQDMYSTWAYEKIVPLQRIEFIQNLADKDGNRIEPEMIGMPPDFPPFIRTVVTFKPLGDKTEMTITEYGVPGPDTQIGKYAELGLNQSMDKMAAIFDPSAA